ncbi:MULTISPECIES: DDE-type integrase/transposase/recombinase [unclassified Serratia (in: enterobacteria)]
MDETYIKVNGKWVYLYQAVDNAPTVASRIRCRHCES